MPALEDKEQNKANKAPKEKNIEEKEDVTKMEDTPVILDDDGWEDVLGSGRLKKKIVRVGEEGCKPGKGARVKVKVEERVDGQAYVRCSKFSPTMRKRSSGKPRYYR